MATRDELELLAGKALLEPDFLRQMRDDPEAAASSVGIRLTSQQVEYLQHVNRDNADAFDQAASQAQEAMGPQPITAWSS